MIILPVWKEELIDSLFLVRYEFLLIPLTFDYFQSVGFLSYKLMFFSNLFVIHFSDGAVTFRQPFTSPEKSFFVSSKIYLTFCLTVLICF
jgi:hypothetical protein